MMKLDFGCGNGGYPGTDAVHPRNRGSWLESHGDSNTVAIDVEPIRVKEARYKINRDISFVLADGRRLPFSDGSFDYVREWGVMHHIGNWEKALNDIARVMKKGAIMEACETVDNDPLYAWCRTVAGNWKGSPIESRFKSAEFLTGLQKHFTIDNVEYWHRPLVVDIPAYFLNSFPGMIIGLYWQYYSTRLLSRLGLLPRFARHVSVRAIRK